MSFDRYRHFTQARIGLGSHGPALPTKAWLEFAYHHACAVDAIRVPWNMTKHAQEIETLGHQCHIVKSKAQSREEYLMRPDLGRSLHEDSAKACQKLSRALPDDIALMISNGLSSHAVNRHLTPFLSILLPMFNQAAVKLAHDRLLLVANGRVGLIDDVGGIVKPGLGMVIIGERPGLSAPDSLAVYLTYHPKPGRTDAERNCVSNIRPPHGLSYEAASAKVIFLVKEALRRKLTGVMLKEEAEGGGIVDRKASRSQIVS